MPVDSDHTFKVLLLGDTNVGKTALILRFVDNIFSTHDTSSSSVGAQFKIRSTMVDGKVIKWHLSDSSGSDRFRTITAAFLRAGDVIMLTFDVTNRDSFDSLEVWIGELSKNAREDALAVLVGCKADQERIIPAEDIRAFAKEHRLLYFETSAQAPLGVEDMFEAIGMKLLSTLQTKASLPGAAVRGNGSAHAGWLVKRGSRWPHRWQRRWFVLDNTQLSYSRTNAVDSPILGHLDIDAIIGLRLEGDEPEFGFSLRTPTRTLYMQALSSIVRDQWMDKLSDVIRVLPATRLQLQHPLPDLSRGEIVLQGILKPHSLPISVHHPKLEQLYHASEAVEFYRYIRNLKKLGTGHRNILGFHGFTALPIPLDMEGVGAETRMKLSNMAIRTTPAVLLDFYEASMDTTLFKGNIKLTLYQALQMMLGVGSAVEYLHSRSIIHSDIAANNIACAPDLTLKLRLLPSCRSFNKTGADCSGDQGQPGYRAPECILGLSWNAMVDIYALGILFFEIAHQRPAFFYRDSRFKMDEPLDAGVRPEPPEEISETGANETVQRLINEMLSIEPSERPVAKRVMTAFQQELAKVQSSSM
eukprot:m.261490 g.261490  ORF g.261490 m.261490 type:complete len:586 (+) comp44945_c0_seq1:180-1937(+)